jgi:hypothetical protein
VSVRSLTHKLVLRTDPLDHDHHSELYDLQADPLEMRNVYGAKEHAAVQANLTARVLRWMITTSDVTRWELDPRGGGYPWPKPHSKVPPDFGEDTPLGMEERLYEDVVFW